MIFIHKFIHKIQIKLKHSLVMSNRHYFHHYVNFTAISIFPGFFKTRFFCTHKEISSTQSTQEISSTQSNQKDIKMRVRRKIFASSYLNIRFSSDLRSIALTQLKAIFPDNQIFEYLIVLTQENENNYTLHTYINLYLRIDRELKLDFLSLKFNDVLVPAVPTSLDVVKKESLKDSNYLCNFDFNTSIFNSSSKFKLIGTDFLLTYPQIIFDSPNQIEQDKLKELVLNYFLKNFLGIKTYIISREFHADGNPHLHVYLSFEDKFYCMNSRVFDIEVGGKNFHGDYQKVRHAGIPAMLKYITKKHDYLTNLKPAALQSLKLTIEETLRAIAFNEGILAMSYYANKTYPDWYDKKGLKFIGGIKRALEVEERLSKQERLSIGAGVGGATLQMEAYDLISKKTLLILARWIARWRSYDADSSIFKKVPPTLVLVGKEGTGKSQLARTILTYELHRHFLEISTVQNVGDFSSKIHNGLLIDDISFSNRDEALNILDSATEKNIRIYYEGQTSIPRGIPRILTTNRLGIIEDYPEIIRRLLIVKIESKLSSKFTSEPSLEDLSEDFSEDLSEEEEAFLMSDSVKNLFKNVDERDENDEGSQL